MDFNAEVVFKEKYAFLEGRCQLVEEPYYKGFNTKQECQEQCAKVFMEVSRNYEKMFIGNPQQLGMPLMPIPNQAGGHVQVPK